MKSAGASPHRDRAGKARAARAHAATAGFTLLELSIVVAIIAVVTGMAITSGIAVIATARQSATTQKMAAIDQAYYSFRSANDRLPCPADLTAAPGSSNYGVEAANPGSCTGGTPAANNTAPGQTNTATVAEGGVPTATLGLPSDMMYDGWGDRIRYAVDTNYTGYNYFPAANIGCVGGGITIYDATGTRARTTGAIYALISQGANQHGAYVRTGSSTLYNGASTNNSEQTNCHCNSSATATTYAPTYVQAPYTVDPVTATNGFDDIVTFKERWQLQVPQDAAPITNIYVVDDANLRIQKADACGRALSQFPCSSGACSSSYSNGQMATGWVSGGAADSSGNIWVADTFNHRLQKFNSTGTWQASLGGPSPHTCQTTPNGSVPGCASSTDTGGFNQPEGLYIDTSGYLWVADSNNSRVQKLSSSGAFALGIGASYNGIAGSVGISGYLNGQFLTPRNVAVDKSANIWVTDSGNNRVQKFNSAGTWLLTIGGGLVSPGNGATTPSAGCTTGPSSSPACATGTASSQFSGPTGITVDPAGNIWVADNSNYRLQVFNSSGSFLKGVGAGYNGVSGAIGASGNGNGQFAGPVNMTGDPNGNIWVADSGANRIEEFNSGGTFLQGFGSGYNGVSGAIGSTGTGLGQYNALRTVIVYPAYPTTTR